jgi:hypothetical protein
MKDQLKGLYADNIQLAEAPFGKVSYVERVFQNAHISTVSGVVMAGQNGLFESVEWPDSTVEALLGFARKNRKALQQSYVDAEDAQKQAKADAEEEKRRRVGQGVEKRLLESAKFMYMQRVGPKDLAAALRMIAEDGGEAKQREFLKNQLNIYVKGAGYRDLKTTFSSSRDGSVGRVPDLEAKLRATLDAVKHRPFPTAPPEVNIFEIIDDEKIEGLTLSEDYIVNAGKVELSAGDESRRVHELCSSYLPDVLLQWTAVHPYTWELKLTPLLAMFRRGTYFYDVQEATGWLCRGLYWDEALEDYVVYYQSADAKRATKAEECEFSYFYENRIEVEWVLEFYGSKSDLKCRKNVLQVGAGL